MSGVLPIAEPPAVAVKPPWYVRDVAIESYGMESALSLRLQGDTSQVLDQSAGPKLLEMFTRQVSIALAASEEAQHLAELEARIGTALDDPKREEKLEKRRLAAW